MASVLTIRLIFAGSISAEGDRFFKGFVSPEHDFLWRESKAFGPML
jgi:hypothetical protein